MSARTDRNGMRPDYGARKTTLPPLPSLLEPLYIVGEGKDPPPPRKAPRPRQKPAAGGSEIGPNLDRSPPPKPKPKAGDKLARFLWPSIPRKPGS